MCAAARRRGTSALAAVAACACTGSVDAPELDVRSVEVEAPHPLVRALAVRLGSAADVTVEYGTDEGPPLRVSAPADPAPRLVLTGLKPSRTYRYTVVGSAAAGSFTTDPLPADLARVGFAATGDLTIPLVLVHLYDRDGFRGYAVVDGRGTVRWYWRTDDFPFGMTRRANGNFVFMDKARGLVEVTPAGVVARELPQDLARGEMHHDVIATPRNTLLFIAFDPGEHSGRPLLGEAVWEWTPESGALLRRWSSWDSFSPDSDRGPRFGAEWMHANALANGARGSVLLSLHYFNQIVSIAPDWKTVEWRLGGVNATIPVPDAERFSGQHTPGETSPGRILVFDNRVERRGYSRAVELDLTGDSARRVWAWAAEPPNFASAVGSARRLPDGNTLVAFGMSAGLVGSSGPTEVFEVSPAGTVLWHLVVSETSVMFRAEPLDAVGTERVAEGGPDR